MLWHRYSLTRIQFGLPKLTEKEKHKGDEVQKPFPGKEQEKSPKTVKNETDFCSLTRLWLQKGDSENTEGLKAEYQGNKTRYKK